MKRISYETAKLAAKAGYNEPNEVYYCLDQNNNPKIECIIPDEPGIQNSDFEDLYTVPYTYELIDWLRNTHKIYISIFPVTWFQLSVNIYKIEENQVKEIFAVNTAVELYQNSEALQQLPEKSLNAFNRILDSICEEEKNDSKDESR